MADTSPSTASAVTRWRQRIAGGLLVIGGVGFIVSYCVPWKYAYWPDPCPTCVSETRAPADNFLHMFSPLGAVPSTFFLAITVAIVIGLPLALLGLGVWLLARQRPVPLGRKVLVIVAGVIGLCAAYLLTLVTTLDFMGWSASIRTEPGQYLAFAGALAVLVAGLVMARERLISSW